MADKKLSEARVLVVDDVAFTLHRLTQTLERIGIGAVESAENGEEACDRLKSASPPLDLVIADYQMPRMNGLELLRELRSGRLDGVPHDTAFVILTGYLELDKSIPAVRLGVDGLLSKPISYAVAERRIADLLGDAPERDVGAAERYTDIELDTGGTIMAETAPPSEDEGEELPISRVEPGAVLASDLNYPNGKLLLARNSRLHAALLHRLQEVAELSGGITRVRVRV